AVGHGPADHVARDGLEDVVAGDAVVVGVGDGDPAAAGAGRLVQGDAVGPGTDDQAQAVVAVDGGRARRLAYDARARARVDAADGEQFVVRAQAGHAVRVDAPAVGGGEDVGGQARLLLGHAQVTEDARAELVQARPGEDAGRPLGAHLGARRGATAGGERRARAVPS